MFRCEVQPVGFPCGSSCRLAGLHCLHGCVLSRPVPSRLPRVPSFVDDGTVYLFRALCFGLFAAPPVFLRVLAPFLVLLHNIVVRVFRYRGDWLLLLPPGWSLYCFVPQLWFFVSSWTLFWLSTSLFSLLLRLRPT